MTMGLVGRKRGMTRVFTEDGNSIPVTVIEAQPNRITQVKSVENDGYRALQVSAGFRKASRVSKPEAGHFAMAKVEAGDLMTEPWNSDTCRRQRLMACKAMPTRRSKPLASASRLRRN